MKNINKINNLPSGGGGGNHSITISIGKLQWFSVQKLPGAPTVAPTPLLSLRHASMLIERFAHSMPMMFEQMSSAENEDSSGQRR
jgi:hypothetical protein